MKVEWDGKEYEYGKSMPVYRLLEELSLSREAHLVVANNKLVTEDFKLGTDDVVRIIRVVSGG